MGKGAHQRNWTPGLQNNNGRDVGSEGLLHRSAHAPVQLLTLVQVLAVLRRSWVEFYFVKAGRIFNALPLVLIQASYCMALGGSPCYLKVKFKCFNKSIFIAMGS